MAWWLGWAWWSNKIQESIWSKNVYEIKEPNIIKKISFLFQQYFMWWNITVDHKFQQLCSQEWFQIIDGKNHIFLYKTKTKNWEDAMLFGKYYYCDDELWFYANNPKNLSIPYYKINLQPHPQEAWLKIQWKCHYRITEHILRDVYKAEILTNESEIDWKWLNRTVRHIEWSNFIVLPDWMFTKNQVK